MIFVYDSRMNMLRFVMLLALVVWLGALIFFPLVAGTAFTNLPAHSAGLMVRGSLLKLHWMALTCGFVFLVASLIYNRTVTGRTRALNGSHLLILCMLALTAITQFNIIPRMENLRFTAGEISELPISDPIRAQFDALHAWSTRIESAVLVLGILLLYLTSRRLAGRN